MNSRYLLPAPALFGLAALCVALALKSPNVYGQVTTASLSTSQTSYKGLCPATIEFSGVVKGAPKTEVRYYFQGPKSGPPTGKPVTATLLDPLNLLKVAQLPVSERLTVDSAHAGKHWRELVVRSGGQKIYSDKVHYTVNCEAFGGLPGGRLQVQRPAASLAAPGLPEGEYSQTCRDVRVVNTTLFARCKTTAGKWISAKIAHVDRCAAHRIANQNGQLVCER